MKNFVLLIAPPPPTPVSTPHTPRNILNSLHNFTPVGFYGRVSAQPSGSQTPPEHQRDRAGININDRLEKGKLEGRFHTLDARVFLSGTSGDWHQRNNRGFTCLFPARPRPWL